MAHIQDGQTTTLAGVDTATNGLKVKQVGVGTVTFNQNDFTKDSFERLRTADVRIAFEYTFGALLPSSATTTWESTAVSSGTSALTTNLYGTNLTTTTTSGSGYWVQSFAHTRYAQGISTVQRFTFCFNTLQTGVTQRIGMFTDQGTFPSTNGDGFFLEASGTTINIVTRSLAGGATGTETRIPQSSWNMNTMQGAGDVGVTPVQNAVTLNWAISQHLVVEYQWLGVGTMRFGFETGAAGIVWVHQISSVNNASTAWCRTGSLPVRAEIYNATTLTTAATLTLINVVVQQEGDVMSSRGWRYFSANSGTAARLGNATTGWYPVMSLRAASTNDLTKRATIIPVRLDIVITAIATASTSCQVGLIMNPTPNTGATFAVTTAGSVVTVDTAATPTTAVTGTTIMSWVIPNVAGVYSFDLTNYRENANQIGYNAAGTVAITGSSVLTVGTSPLTGAASSGLTVAASITWKELV